MTNQETTAQPAFFVIADISGYTKFMSETEIAHATGILETLFGAIIPIIRAPLAVSGLQGDAVFAYAFDSEVMGRQFILDFAEKLYFAFAHAKEKMLINTGCPCAACKSMAELELKVVVHHGRCMVQHTNGRNELAGPDVITAFRLLKNGVKARTGLSAYLLMSCDAVRQMDLGDMFDPSEFQSEDIEHIGRVEYVVRDLHQAWERQRDLEHVFVSSHDPLLMAEWVQPLPVAPDIAFTLCTRPDFRARWMQADGIDISQASRGRVAPGTVFHCHHGKDTFLFEITDWQPGDYATGIYRLPMGLFLKETTEFEPMGEGTLVKIRLGEVEGGTLIGRLMRGMVSRKLKAMIEPNRDQRLGLLLLTCPPRNPSP